uniref:BTB domain-containing protein n=1 Tax=Caenorhabditis japonica TaxID=281687 RepID=A0A8R1IEY5_CAEJA
MSVQDCPEVLRFSLQILATSSKFFHALFYSKFSESSQQEIKLVDVKHLEFVDFLNLIYPTHKCIDEDNVEHLLKLADRLEAPSVLEKCEEYLISSNEVHKVMKLKYAEIYKLSRLQDKCLNTITSRQDIVTLSKHEDYKSLGDCTYNVLLQKMIELNC